MIHCTFLNKREKDLWLTRLFDLLYDNMSAVTPRESTYEQEKEQWLANVSPALDKDPRQIVLCFVDNDLAGYLQYYTRDNLLMVEEAQIKKAFQRTFAFYHLCKYLISNLPTDIEYIEAYADKRNLYSRKLMNKLGMEQINDTEASPFVHFRGYIPWTKDRFQSC